MFSEALHDLAKPKVMPVLEAVKRSDGLSVAQLADELEMSYMGVKQHCVKLENMGYLKTWRVPRGEAGRPEKLYKLTDKCDALFPQVGVGLTLDVLESVRKVYGESAPERLLYHHFEELGKRWQSRVQKGKSLVERATRLTELRQQEGCFSRCRYSPENGFCIEEYHHPLEKVYEKYPNVLNLEIKMMEKLLASKVVRKVLKAKRGTQVVVYEIDTLGCR